MKLLSKKRLFMFLILFIGVLVLSFQFVPTSNSEEVKARFWNFQAVDTMKYSRDLAREKLNDTTYDVSIEQQIKHIADTGATHVGIATPYDAEFLPFLKRWVSYARKYNLNVWFRGNFSGWEGWFEYAKIDRNRHIELTRDFILINPELFEDGDVFSACPECENGGPGDPRMNGDSEGHKKFLIDEYAVTKKAFSDIGKDVASNYHSMNGDVADLIMDKTTTKKLDGVVVVDHYVKTPETLNEDIKRYALQSGGKVVLGEYGAPIPDIHGNLSEAEQAEWVNEALLLLSQNEHLVGLSYWTNMGGSTQLWNQDGSKRAVVDPLSKAYKPYTIKGKVVNVFNRPIADVTVTYGGRTQKLEHDGMLSLPSLLPVAEARIEAKGYTGVTVELSEASTRVVLQREKPSFLEKILKLLTAVPLPFLT